MKKHYFNLDKVTSITITMEKESPFRWRERISARPKKFLGITIGYHQPIPAGWNEYVEEDENSASCKWRKSTDWFDEYSWYRIDHEKLKVFIKPCVTINLGYKESIMTRFESNEEAQEWIDSLVAESGKKFKIITIN